MTDQTLEKEPLEKIAKQIREFATTADESTIKAALLVRDARARVEAGELGDTTWSEWAPDAIKLSISRLRELQRIGDSDDPNAELERIREQNRKRQASHRDKNKNKPAPLRNGGDETRQAAQLGPKREQLIEIARSASLSHIEKLLTLYQELAAENGTPASDQGVEHAGDADPCDAAPEDAGVELAAE